MLDKGGEAQSRACRRRSRCEARGAECEYLYGHKAQRGGGGRAGCCTAAGLWDAISSRSSTGSSLALGVAGTFVQTLTFLRLVNT